MCRANSSFLQVNIALISAKAFGGEVAMISIRGLALLSVYSALAWFIGPEPFRVIGRLSQGGTSGINKARDQTGIECHGSIGPCLVAWKLKKPAASLPT
jgi:hypothetical protein